MPLDMVVVDGIEILELRIRISDRVFTCQDPALGIVEVVPAFPDALEDREVRTGDCAPGGRILWRHGGLVQEVASWQVGLTGVFEISETNFALINLRYCWSHLCFFVYFFCLNMLAIRSESRLALLWHNIDQTFQASIFLSFQYSW